MRANSPSIWLECHRWAGHLRKSTSNQLSTLGARCCKSCKEKFFPVPNPLIANSTSPTPYNVFTGEFLRNRPQGTNADSKIAYSVTSAYSSNGICVMSSGPAITLPTGYSQPLPSASGKVYLDAAGQQQFIDFLGFSTCSAGGENVVATALIQVTNTTHTTTLTYSSVPLAAISARLTIAPVS